MKVDRLLWDSEFFNKEIGFITIPCSNGIWTPPHGLEAYDLVYVLVQCSGTCCSQFQDTHLYNAGTKITFEQAIQQPHISTPTINAIQRLTESSAQLESLALLSGHKSRYRLDPKFPDSEFQRLYTRWINATIEGQWNAKVFGHFSGPELTGFVTVEASSRYRIGLIAVDPNYQGQGIGKNLISIALHQAAKDITPSLSVSTQGNNIPAQQAYLNSGFRVGSKIQQYHWWNPKTKQQ